MARANYFLGNGMTDLKLRVGNRFSLAIFISCEDQRVSFRGGFFECGNIFLIFFGDDLPRGERVGIHTELAFREIAHMAIRRKDGVVLAEEFRYSLCLCWTFYNYEFMRHLKIEN